MKRGFPFTIIIMIIFLQGCALFKITRSGLRPPLPKSISLSENVTLTATGAVKIQKREFLPASFTIESDGLVIYIDPIEIDDPKLADYIFITHSHLDHLSLPDIRKVAKKETIIICPHSAANKLSGFTVKELEPGDILDFETFKCEAVPAYNLKPVFLWLKAHPKSARNVGYILTIDGMRIYHAGDTDFIPEMMDFADISVALVPLSGGKLTMDVEQAAAAVNAMKSKTVIPMHYELGKNFAMEFARFVDKDIKVEIIE